MSCDTRNLIKVVVAGENELMRAGILSILEDVGEFDVVGSLRSAGAVSSLVTLMRPRLLIIVCHVRHATVSDLSRALKSRVSNLRVLILGATTDPLPSEGGDVYVHQSVTVKAFLAAVKKTLETDQIERPADGGAKTGRALPEHPELTAREVEVLRYLAMGLMDQEIGHKLEISTRTVETHVRHLFLKLGVSNRTQAACRLMGGIEGADQPSENETS